MMMVLMRKVCEEEEGGPRPALWEMMMKEASLGGQ